MSLINEALKKAARLRAEEQADMVPPMPGGGQGGSPASAADPHADRGPHSRRRGRAHRGLRRHHRDPRERKAGTKGRRRSKAAPAVAFRHPRRTKVVGAGSRASHCPPPCRRKPSPPPRRPRRSPKPARDPAADRQHPEPAQAASQHPVRSAPVPPQRPGPGDRGPVPHFRGPFGGRRQQGAHQRARLQGERHHGPLRRPEARPSVESDHLTFVDADGNTYVKSF